MKTVKMLRNLMAAVSLAMLAGSAAANGDIYDIRRCNEDGTTTNLPDPASIANPLGSGEKCYFKIMLTQRSAPSSIGADNDPWFIDHVGVGSEVVDDALYPLQIGIFVSGELRWATLRNEIQYKAAGGGYTGMTGLIFEYVTKPGDFALPIRLATATASGIKPADDLASEGTGFVLEPARAEKWAITNKAGDTCNLWFWTSNGTYPPDYIKHPDGGSRAQDYSLEKCKFYVKTVDFDSNWEEPGTVWRSVHQNSTITGNGIAPALEMVAAGDEKVTLYVWSEDESKVKINGGTTKQLLTDKDAAGNPSYRTGQVGKIEIEAGKAKANFSIFGVAEGITNLVLSAWDNYTWNSGTGTRNVDYLTVPVRCSEPLPASVVVDCDKPTAFANGDYLNAAAVLSVYLTQPSDVDVDVTITPTFDIDGTKTDWANYLRFSTLGDSLSILPDDSLPVIRIKAGSTEKQFVWVYALRAENDYTVGTGKQIRLTPSIPEEQQTASGIDRFSDCGLWISADKPLIVTPDDKTTYSVTAGDELEITVAVSDTYADMSDTATGYTVSIKPDNASSWQTLSETFKASGEGGELVGMTSGKPPTVKYSNAGSQTSIIKVTSPVSTKTSEPVEFTVNVSAARTVKAELIDTDSNEFTEGDIVKFQIELSAQNSTGGKIYAFLLSEDPDIDLGVFGGSSCIVTDESAAQPSAKGVTITATGTSVQGRFTVLDGKDLLEGGSEYFFTVLLCKSQTWDPAQRIDYPTTEGLDILVFNKEPYFKNVKVNGFKSVNGEKIANQYPKGQEVTIQPEFNDVAYDLEHGFTYAWTASCNGKGKANGEVTNAAGTSINSTSFTYNFPQAGEWTIKLEAKDKDMTGFSELDYPYAWEFYVTVLNQPAVEVSVDDLYYENAKSSNIRVGLGYYDDDIADDIVVKLTLTPPAGDNPGIFKLPDTYRAVPAGYAPLGDNEYYLVYDSAEEKTIKIEAMDGTSASSIKGWQMKAEVVTTSVSTDATMTWAQYYLPAEVGVYVENTDPVCQMLEPSTNAWEVSGGLATQHPIRWKVLRDVEADFAGIASFPGIKVNFSGCDNATTIWVTESQDGVFIPDFGSASGDQTVFLTVEDKDGAYLTWEYHYFIAASKTLKIKATGPSGGTTTSRLSQKYVEQEGIGKGHVFVKDVTFAGASAFETSWNCRKDTSATVFGFGYKHECDDDGTLNGMDVAIDADGSNANAAATVDTPYHYADKDGKDSFFYCWLLTATGNDGGQGAVSILNDTIAPERPGAPASGQVPLPNEMTQDNQYLTTFLEAIFSKEWLPEDNLGDINGDGVPDVFAQKNWKGGRLLQLVYGDENGTTADVYDLAQSNPDEDFLPGVCNPDSTMKDSYAPDPTQPFTTFMELRGMHQGLNAIDQTASDPCFSEAETNAWRMFVLRQPGNEDLAEAYDAEETKPGADADFWADARFAIDGTTLTQWSPEPRGNFDRMDPTMADTDGDGFDDGWEYFMWYRAHVSVPAGATAPKKGQTYALERFDPQRWIFGTEIPAAEAAARFNPLVRLEPETLKDDPDFDGDGLSDMEEYIIGTDPCHWDTDGDHMCDGWEFMMGLNPFADDRNGNDDHDFMAYFWTYGVLGYNPNPDDPASPWYFDVYGQLQYGLDYYYEGFTPVMLRNVSITALRIFPKLEYGLEPVLDETGAPVTDAEGKPLMARVPIGPFFYGRIDDMPDEFDFANPWVYQSAMAETPPDEDMDGVPDWMVSVIFPKGEMLSEFEDYVIIHDQVHDAFGFDPRTAWNMDGEGLVNGRWFEDGYTGVAVNTKGYCAYDEYLLARYRVNYGILYPGEEAADLNDLKGRWNVLQKLTTKPTVELLGEASSNSTAQATNQTASAYISRQIAEIYTSSMVVGHGADTDSDGVPDGWELYTFRNPSVGYGMEEDPQAMYMMYFFEGDIEDDGLTYAEEYAGTDSCDAYADCDSIYKNHPGNNMGWFNKFFPTNPDNGDTDGDGISDSSEGSSWRGGYVDDRNEAGAEFFSFIYGTPTDDGSCCIRGGGMNPCTMDTDIDGLPDPWEMQFCGIPVDLATRGYWRPSDPIDPNDPGDGVRENPEFSDAMFIADGIFNVEGLEGVYIADGMDATWPGDVFTDPYEENPVDCHSYDELLGTVRDVDFDHDGLQNYQEYLVQTVRHFRWDDISTPLMGRVLYEGMYDPMTGLLVKDHEQAFNGFVSMEQDYGNMANAAAYAWYGLEGIDVSTQTNAMVVSTNEWSGVVVTNWLTQVVTNVSDYATEVNKFLSYTTLNHTFSYPWCTPGWRYLGYMAYPTYGWDRLNTATQYPVVLYPPSGAGGYVSTDPRSFDTDGDGMDDYYEMFHGLNPLLGSSSAGAKDVIADAYGMAPFYNACWNEWTHPDYNHLYALMGDPMTARGALSGAEALDCVLYPWMAGVQEGDPDGDGLRNSEEMLLANATSPAPSHTDPTPLWMTDKTSAKSYVAQYYPLSYPVTVLPYWPAAYSAIDEYYPAALDGQKGAAYAYAFEENEGYDTDNDWVPDGREIIKTTKVATDPLDFGDPNRRQAVYLPGKNGFLMTTELQYRSMDAQDMLKQFTVECWVRPERHGVDQTILDRSSWYSAAALNKLSGAIRSNFRIGLAPDGRVYGMFDNTDAKESGSDQPVSCQRLDGQVIPVGTWAHVALAYNGKELKLYQNGDVVATAKTTLIPANGVALIHQDVASTNSFPSESYEFVPTAFFVGARPKLMANPGDRTIPLYPYTADHRESFANYQEYFQGYVDEVRIWDGALTSGQIASGVMTRMTHAAAEENRQTVYQNWVAGATRNDNDGTPMLPAELIAHYSFVNLPGAVKEKDVAKLPVDFKNAVNDAVEFDYGKAEMKGQEISTAGLYPNLAELKGGETDWTIQGGIVCGWWDACKIHSTVYSDYRVIPWVENTAAHLTPLDGSCLDSFHYGEALGGYYVPAEIQGVGSFTFPNSAMPYQYTDYTLDRYIRMFKLRRLVEQYGEQYEPLHKMYQFECRSHFIGTSDLVPMGGAFAKTCDDLWDGGAADAWEYTGNDVDGNGLPDWWEWYARENYCDNLDPSENLEWDTLIMYEGAEMPAYMAYLIDLARGMQPDGGRDSRYAATVDADGDNLPDWWEDIFGVREYGADDDPDNDGLSNFAEYQLSFGDFPYGFANGFPLLDPLSPRTGKDQLVTDYFLPGPTNDIDAAATHISANSYLGEIATDHDFMETWWEKQYPTTFSNAYVYDPDLDRDGDGWSNWAECRASIWNGSYVADLIDRYVEDGVHAACYPEPAIGVKATYFGTRDVSGAGLVVRTYSAQTPRVDATYVVTPTSGQIVRFVGGMNSTTAQHGFLTPGHIDSSSVMFERAVLSGDRSYNWDWTWYDEQEIVHPEVDRGPFTTYKSYVLRYPHIVLAGVELNWNSFAIAISDADGRMAKIMDAQSASEIGWMDLRTGEWELDSAKLAAADTTGDDLDSCVLRISYKWQLGNEWPQTVWLSDTLANAGGEAVGHGHVREGLNTVEAFFDLDGDGIFTPGEPYGMLQNVNVGWHKTRELVIELKDDSSTMSRTLVGNVSAAGAAGTGADGASGATTTAEANSTVTKVQVRRALINGQPMINGKAVPNRVLASVSAIMDDRDYVTEADIVAADKPDIDWKWLARDAEKLGLLKSELESATYRVVLPATVEGEEDVILAEFENVFNSTRATALPLAPIQSQPVYAAAPTFTFTCSDETLKAYQLQIATDTNAAAVVYDTGVKILPGRTAYTTGTRVYEVTPELYANAQVLKKGDAVFADGTNYFWRVALLNAKYNTTDASSWSSWAAFQMDVANTKRYPQIPTGYGNVAAVVRYFGTAKNMNLTNSIVIEAHASADFSGVPLARVRLADTAQLSDITDVTTTNAVMRGLEPGKVYLMAYIDFNDNGKRDSWESWGYVNGVGTDVKTIYNPVAVTVTDVFNSYPKAVIYIEDCDVNRNEIPDCNEPDVFAVAGESVLGDDIDRDGIGDDSEDSYATDMNVWDSDGDGMPDGWEALFADTDPLTPDADEATEGDVMAYAEIKRTLVTFDDGTQLLLAESERKLPQTGDPATNYLYDATYAYGRDDLYGLGQTNVTAAAESRVESVAEVTVALVHAQVYDRFGYSAYTANSTVSSNDWKNTKAFTALDKYLVIRYLDAIGAITNVPAGYANGEDWVNVNGLWAKYSMPLEGMDADRDGVADGWELYVMYGTEGSGARPVNEAAVSPWDATPDYVRDAANTPDGGNLSILDEFDRGHLPTDPWRLDSDGDKVPDEYEFAYDIKGRRAQADDDGDGLCNYVEYLMSEVFKLGKKFDVADAFSANDFVPDYFFRVGNLYMGEVFGDFDRIRDSWEDKYDSDYVTRYRYDANLDPDGDGWSNYAEFQAGTDPTKLGSLGIDGVQVDEYPVPTIEARIAYYGRQSIQGAPIVVKAWRGGDLTRIPDARWTVGAAGKTTMVGTAQGGSVSNTINGVKYVGMNPGKEQLLHLSPGGVVPGSVQLEAKDLNWYVADLVNGGGWVYGSTSAMWNQIIADRKRNDDSGKGDLYVESGSGATVGEIDYATGAVTIRFQDIDEEVFWLGDLLTGQGAEDGSLMSVYTIPQSYIRINWQSKQVGGGSAGTYYLAEADDPAGGGAAAGGSSGDASGASAGGGNNSVGHVKEGSNLFVAFADLDGNGAYSAGEPYGVATDVDIGWNYGKFAIEMTDTSPIIARFTVSDIEGTNDREILWGTDSGNFDRARITEGQLTDGQYVRVRVIRTMVDGSACARLGIPSPIVLDKTVALGSDEFITEADFIRDGAFDIDWATLATDTARLGLPVTNVMYRIVLGNGSVENTGTNNLLNLGIVRRFDTAAVRSAVLPVPENLGIVTRSNPVFRWYMPAGLNTYTAFRIQVTGVTDTGFTWDSGIQPMPARSERKLDRSGTEIKYEWEAPIFVGAKLANGKIFKNGADYNWKVTVYNARFRDDAYSSASVFKMNVPTGSADYGQINAAVRYYGPSEVASSGTIRVQAFETPDFSGLPVGEGYVSSSTTLNATGALSGNAKILGLRAGKYYLRAYIDTNSNGRFDDWESWGFLCHRDEAGGETIYDPMSVQVGPETGPESPIAIYIEDSDTDHDGIPDAWEMAQAGNLTKYTATASNQLLDGGYTAAKTLATITKLTDAAPASTGLETSTAALRLSSPVFLAAMAGANPANPEMPFADAIEAALSGEVTSVEISDFSVGADGKVTLGVVTDAPSVSEEKGNLVGFLDQELSATVRVTVLWKASLGDTWTELTTRRITVTSETKNVELEVAAENAGNAGFFSVRLERAD